MRLGPLHQRYFFATAKNGECAIWDRGEVADGRVVRVQADRARWLCAYFRGEATSTDDARAAQYFRARFLELHEALGAYWRARLPNMRRAA